MYILDCATLDSRTEAAPAFDKAGLSLARLGHHDGAAAVVLMSAASQEGRQSPPPASCRGAGWSSPLSWAPVRPASKKALERAGWEAKIYLVDATERSPPRPVRQQGVAG